MITSIITAEIVCAIVMVIIGYAVFTEKRVELSHRFFVGCIVSVFVILVSDCLSYVFDGNIKYTSLLFILNLLTLVVGDFLMIFFSLYVSSFVKEKKKKDVLSKPFIYVVATISTIDFIFEIIGSILNKTFIIENGIFIPGPLYDVGFYIQLFVMAIIMVYLIVNIKVIGNKTLLVFIAYYIFPVTAIITIIINPLYSFICSSIAISFLVIYVGIEKEVESRDVFMSKLLNTDILTGIANRYAYEEEIKNCNSNKQKLEVGVIFCDLNRLKQINDEQGHEAGDKYIICFSKILLKCFEKQSIYRISGDEFVVINKNNVLDDFEKKYEKLEKEIDKENHIASCGKSTGTTENISAIVKEAEHNMYLEKKEYYSKSGINRRRG